MWNGHRQFVDSGGWYDRDKLYWKEILDVVLVAACAPPSGGRSPLTPRFVRHLAMLHVAAPDTHAMTTIFKVRWQLTNVSLTFWEQQLLEDLSIEIKD